MKFEQAIQSYASLALDGVERHFPYHLSLVFREPRSLDRPADVHPVFHGCFDWHSAVHGHWLLVAASSLLKGTVFSDSCVMALKRTILQESIEVEAGCLRSNASFERPYGLAWLLQLSVEIDRSPLPAIHDLGVMISPLVEVAYENIASWLPRLTHPVRSGTHNQTAFSLKLALDWAIQFNRPEAVSLFRTQAKRLFEGDRDLPLHLEPSGEDFLSPSLSEAWLMSAVYDDEEFAVWFSRTFPDPSQLSLLDPVEPADRRDGRLVHLDGLNLSRCWMMSVISCKLSSSHPEFTTLRDLAVANGRKGLRAALSTEYMASHWLGTFAVYLLMEVDGFINWDELHR